MGKKDKNEQNDYSEEYQNEMSVYSYGEEEEQKVSETYTHRIVQKKQLERKMRQNNMWLARLKVLLRLILIVLLSYCLYRLTICHYWYPDKTIFTKDSPNLQIINNKIVPSYKILTELRKISVSDEPIYRFETGSIKTNLSELEPIEDVFIRRYWFPARIQIIIKERIPLITISRDENSPAEAFFTKDGVLVGKDYLPLNPSIKTTKVIVGGNYREWDKNKIDYLDRLAKRVKHYSNEDVLYIDLRNPNDVFVQIPSCKLRLGGQDEGIFERITRIPSILPQVKGLGKPVQYIDLRWKNACYIKIGTAPKPVVADIKVEQDSVDENQNED